MSLLPFVMKGLTREVVVKTSENKRFKASVEYTLPSNLNIGKFCEVNSLYKVPLYRLTNEEIAWHTKQLTLIPIDPFSKDTTPIYAFKKTETHLFTPRFYGLKEWGPAGTNSTILGKSIDISFSGKLDERQIEPCSKIIQRMTTEDKSPTGGMLCLPCGFGKTVCALYIIKNIAKKALILVHKNFLLEQWKERVTQFCPDAKIGTIQQSKIEVDADIIIGMIQSIAMRDYDSDIFKDIGMICIDESHHMSAPIFNKALQKVPARFVLSLSATPDRRDGMTKLLHWCMGDIIYRTSRSCEEDLKITCYVYDNSKKFKEFMNRDGRPALPQMLNYICQDATRNILIANNIKRLLENGRKIIILSDRINQLETLWDLLKRNNVEEQDMTYYIGKSSKQEREAAPSKKLIFSTYSMSREALDIPSLDTLIMASPTGNVEQAFGRILRKHPNKKVPLVIDFIDPYSIFESMRWKRAKYYKQMTYECQTISYSQTHYNKLFQ